MANLTNGGLNVQGNLNANGNVDFNADLNVDGVTSLTTATATSIVFATHIKLTPTADPPAGAAEGMLYADTDHKLYYHNGTTWKEVTLA